MKFRDRNGNLLKVGDSIENYNRYDGECKKLIVELPAKGFKNSLLVVGYECKKYPNLKGSQEVIDKWDIEDYYEKVVDPVVG